MNMDIIIDSKKAYKAPRTKVIEVNAQSLLCQSNGYPIEFEEENDN